MIDNYDEKYLDFDKVRHEALRIVDSQLKSAEERLEQVQQEVSKAQEERKRIEQGFIPAEIASKAFQKVEVQFKLRH